MQSLSCEHNRKIQAMFACPKVTQDRTWGQRPCICSRCISAHQISAAWHEESQYREGCWHRVWEDKGCVFTFPYLSKHIHECILLPNQRSLLAPSVSAPIPGQQSLESCRQNAVDDGTARTSAPGAPGQSEGGLQSLAASEMLPNLKAKGFLAEHTLQPCALGGGNLGR